MQPEIELLVLLYDEGRLMAQVIGLRRQVDWAVNFDLVGARDGPDTAAGLGHPRDLGTVLETDDQLSYHLHAAPQPLHPAEHSGPVVSRRHEVRDTHGASRCVPFLVEDERVATVRTACRGAAVLRRQQPPAVLGRPKQGRETGGRVETWHAQPIKRPIPAYEGCGMGVADQCVVFYALAHPSDLRVGDRECLVQHPHPRRRV